MKKVKKILAVVLTIFLMIGRTGFAVVYAEEITSEQQTEEQTTGEEQPVETEATTEEEVTTENTEPSPSPTPTPETTVDLDNESEVINDVDSEAITGENTIEEPTPTPSPTIEPDATREVQEDTAQIEESPCIELEEECAEAAQEEEGASSETTQEETTGGQQETSEPAETENTDSGVTIDTGNAVSVTEVENAVNTTVVESQVMFQTLNIIIPEGQDIVIDPLVIADQVVQEGKTDPVLTVSVLDVNNYSYVSNDIVSEANTGENQIQGAGDSTINTGDAYSIVSLLNEINTTIVDSTIHIITINIFGEVEGNIILPEFGPDLGDCCGGDTGIDNVSYVDNNVESSAVSGQNSIISSEESDINTGQAMSQVNVVNVVNATFIDTVFHYLYINTLGGWVGSFLGWDGFEAIEGGGNLVLNSIEQGMGGDECDSCIDDALISNYSYIENNVSSYANTGNNNTNGGSANIVTGNAYSEVSIFNLINSSIIRSIGFLGSINIFGYLEGDIGGASLFIEEEVVETEDSGEPGPSIREAGGQLTIYQYNNIGEFVYPGDTVTFFITIRNPGTGRVYDTVLDLILIKDGVDMGGATWNLGDLKQQEGFQITTGLTLSEDAEPGTYIAHAVVSGLVGPDNEVITAYSDSFVPIMGMSLPVVPEIVEEIQASEPDKVLAMSTAPFPPGNDKERMLELIFLGLLSIYFPIKGYKKRDETLLAITNGVKFAGEKSLALRSVLMSFFV